MRNIWLNPNPIKDIIIGISNWKLICNYILLSFCTLLNCSWHWTRAREREVEGLDIGQGRERGGGTRHCPMSRERGGGTRHWTRERERWRASIMFNKVKQQIKICQCVNTRLYTTCLFVSMSNTWPLLVTPTSSVI
jgi:hypothetical protein